MSLSVKLPAHLNHDVNMPDNAHKTAQNIYKTQSTKTQNTNTQSAHQTLQTQSANTASATNEMTEGMRGVVDEVSQLLKSVSHPDRLLLLCQLAQGEYCVSELEALVGLGQPSLSQQLGVLRKDNLVHTRREGKQIYYTLASEDALALLQLLHHRFTL